MKCETKPKFALSEKRVSQSFERIGPLFFFQDVGASRRKRCPLDKRIKSLTPSLTSAMKFVNR